MENPPDLIVAVPSDEQYHDRRKVTNELLSNFQSDKSAVQLRIQQSINNDNEFNEQSYLLKQRFHDEIQSLIDQQTELVQQAADNLTVHITDVLRKSIHDIESLRLLHQKELCTHSKAITDCIQYQSCEMSQLCHHLIDQQNPSNTMNLFVKLLNDFQIAFGDLKTSFDSKINYLNDIHSTTIDKLQSKYETELNEMKCELNLVSNR